MNELSNRGVHFTNAVCPSPLCGPSRSILASGREYDRCSVESNEVFYPQEQPTYHQRLRDEAGYHVAICGKFHIGENQPAGLHEFFWGLDGRAWL